MDLHDQLRAAQLKVAAEIERARRIQTDLLPASIPEVAGVALEQRIEFLGEMGGDYYDYIPFGDGRLGIVCGDVMGKGLAAALIMAMARSLLHDAIAPGKRPVTCWRRSTTGSRATSRASVCPTSSRWLSPYATPPTAAWSSPAAVTTRCSSPPATACVRCRRAAPPSASVPACGSPRTPSSLRPARPWPCTPTA